MIKICKYYKVMRLLFKYIPADQFRGKANIVFKSNPNSKLEINCHVKHVSASSSESNIYVDLTKVDQHFHKPILFHLAKKIYRFRKYKKATPEVTIFIISKLPVHAYAPIIACIKITNMARDLASEPANIIYPESFCEYVSQLKWPANAHITIYDEHDLERMQMGLITGVGGGSRHAPRLLVIEINKDSPSKICLVGKGVTFDSGGYNIKTTNSMASMRQDKTGASIVTHVMYYLAHQKPTTKCGYVAVIPIVENIVSNASYKPGDILTSFNGKTVEVLNTDAEGRLILADAIAYAVKTYGDDIKCLVDIATLTGWTSSLHCDIDFSYFTMNANMAARLDALQMYTGERSIRQPPWLEYRVQTKSTVADYINAVYPKCTKSEGFMASMFLSNFLPDSLIDKWLHIDIAHNYDSTSNTILCNAMHTLIEFVRIQQHQIYKRK